MAIFFHECCQDTKEIMNINPQIIIIFGQSIFFIAVRQSEFTAARTS